MAVQRMLARHPFFIPARKAFTTDNMVPMAIGTVSSVQPVVIKDPNSFKTDLSIILVQAGQKLLLSILFLLPDNLNIDDTGLILASCDERK